jgi:hypothetical protein
MCLFAPFQGPCEGPSQGVAATANSGIVLYPSKTRKREGEEDAAFIISLFNLYDLVILKMQQGWYAIEEPVRRESAHRMSFSKEGSSFAREKAGLSGESPSSNTLDREEEDDLRERDQGHPTWGNWRNRREAGAHHRVQEETEGTRVAGEPAAWVSTPPVPSLWAAHPVASRHPVCYTTRISICQAEPSSQAKGVSCGDHHVALYQGHRSSHHPG